MAQIARRHQVSEGLIYRWREKFFEGGKSALAFDGRQGSGGEKAALERQVEELQNLIGEQAVEIRFFKTAVEGLRPSWMEVEAARVDEGLTVKAAMEILGLSRSSYYRQVRGMSDYQAHPEKRAPPSMPKSYVR
jgi:hypothetical protein